MQCQNLPNRPLIDVDLPDCPDWASTAWNDIRCTLEVLDSLANLASHDVSWQIASVVPYSRESIDRVEIWFKFRLWRIHMKITQLTVLGTLSADPHVLCSIFSNDDGGALARIWWWSWEGILWLTPSKLPILRLPILRNELSLSFSVIVRDSISELCHDYFITFQLTRMLFPWFDF